MVLRRGFKITMVCGRDLISQWIDMLKTVSKQTTNAERLTKHRQGVATRLKRIEVALEDLRNAFHCMLSERPREQQQAGLKNVVNR
jgi:hypothetical protein